MATCAVIDLATNEQVNLIVADPSELPPDGCRLVELPEGFYWNGTAVVPVEVPVEMPGDAEVTDGN
jgi:hypothetical protein